MGQAGAWTAEVFFDDVRVPADALIGEEGRGYAKALTVLSRGRLHIAALCVGMAQRVLDESVAYAATAKQGGAPIGRFQLVQAMLADMHAELLAGRSMVREVAGRVRQRRGHLGRAVVGEAVLHRDGRPGGRPRGAGARRHGLPADDARSSASTATPGCSGSTRAPARCSG